MTAMTEQNKLRCEVVQDLLPLYHDDVVNEVTKREIEEHLSACESCTEQYRSLCEDIPKQSGAPQRTTKNLFRLIMKEERRKRIILTTLVCLCAAAVLTGVYKLLFGVNLKPLTSDDMNIIRVYEYDLSDNFYANDSNGKNSKGIFVYYSVDADKLRGGSEGKLSWDNGVADYDFKVPLLSTGKKSDEKYTDIITIPIDDNSKEVRFAGRTIWKKGDAYEEPPAYVEGYHRFEYSYESSGFTVIDDHFILEMPDGTETVWDIDGNVLYEGKQEHEE